MGTATCGGGGEEAELGRGRWMEREPARVVDRSSLDWLVHLKDNEDNNDGDNGNENDCYEENDER